MKARDLLSGLFCQLGVEPARQDRVDLDIVLGPGERQALGQLDDPPLGRAHKPGQRAAPKIDVMLPMLMILPPPPVFIAG